MEIGISSFAALLPHPRTRRTPSAAERIGDLIEEIVVADRAGLDVFGVGEHHRPEYADSAPVVIMAAAAARTKTIRLTSAVSVLSAADPVRLFQDFATLDLVSGGRAEIIVGRGSFPEAYPLFGLNREDYDELFVEKLDLLLKLRAETHVHWSGRFRPGLTGQGVFPRPVQPRLPVWIGVGGTPQSFARAGALGLPLMVAIIGGSFRHFRPLIDLYREAGRKAGHGPDVLRVGIHITGFVAETAREAEEAFYPGWSHAFTKIGRERGWPPVTREKFEAMCGPDGPFLIGDPATVAAKTMAACDQLGGVTRVAYQMSAAADPEKMKLSIELLGTEVAPVVRHEASAPGRSGAMASPSLVID